MFFKKKEKVAPKPLLIKENIKVGCPAADQETVIRSIGQMLVDSGYVNAPYIDAMLAREQSFSTYMGCDLAIPHGVAEGKKEIKASGIAVMNFAEPVTWGEGTVRLVVAIAALGESHLDILSSISEKIMDESSAAALLDGDVDAVYNALVEKE
ncbi:MAG: PTS sugar transporter subunit IIA [Faecalibacterium sp.]